MTSDDKDAQVQAVVNRLVGEPSRNAFRTRRPPLDTSKPNIHDNKDEFQQEVSAVRESIAHLEGYISTIRELVRNDDERSKERLALGRLRLSVNDGAARRLESLQPSSMDDLILKNAAVVGIFSVSLSLIFELRQEFKARLKELKGQERQFWSVRHRPPNHYARALALRLARLYGSEKGKKPTMGTARDGGHPSTEYGRALEEIFSILGVKGGVRGPATWAIKRLSEDDLQPMTQPTFKRAPLAALFLEDEQPRDDMAELAKAMLEPPPR